MVSKRDPKSEQKSSKWVPKTIHNKNTSNKLRKKTMFSTPECQSIINTDNNYDFQVLVLAPFWVSFWSCSGSPNGGKGRQKATSKKQQEHNVKNEPKLVSNGGSQNGAKIAKNEVLEAPCFKGGSQEASRALQDRFWKGFGSIFVSSLIQCW